MSVHQDRPPHVPVDRFVDFDFSSPPGAAADVHLAWAALQKYPEIVWTPRNGGHWIATRAAVIDRVHE